jgi:hypothetical protein
MNGNNLRENLINEQSGERINDLRKDQVRLI